MINLLDLMGGHFHDKIVELVKAGKKFYTVNDKTTVKNMRVDHRNKQHNWFASIVVFERIDFSHLDNVRPLGDIQNFLSSCGENLFRILPTTSIRSS